MVSSAVRPLTVARGGRFRRDRESGTGHGEGQVRQFRHRSLRCVVGPESENLYDALSEKPPRCVVGPPIASGPWARPNLLSVFAAKLAVGIYGQTYCRVTDCVAMRFVPASSSCCLGR